MKQKIQLGVLSSAATDGIVVIDSQGLILSFNAACETLFGYSALDAIGNNAGMLLKSSGSITGKMGTPGIRNEVIGERKDKSTFPMSLTIGEGVIEGKPIFVWIVHNLSNRALEKASKAREARLRSILETVPEALITIDEAGTIESLSQSASLLFGYEAQEVVGQNVTVLMTSPYSEKHGEFVTLHSSPDENGSIRRSRIFIARRRDGTSFPVEVAMGEAVDGSKRLFTAFVHDLTKGKGKEQRLEDLQAELLHASRLSAMGQTTAAIAHELNQPLTAISNYITAAKRALSSKDADADAIQHAKDLIEKARAQTFRASAIVRNLREFVEKRKNNHKPENLNKVVEEALALAFVGAAKRKNLNVQLVLDAKLGQVMIDKVQIQQVLVNLIRNSMEAMQASGKAELTLTTGSGETGFADVTIRDTGGGLSDAVSSQLFQPFITTKDTGMGIGLMICRSILESHGGRIWLIESTGKGTVFRFTLPLVSNMAAAA